MAVAELFIGAFITVLFEKLASGDLIRLARSAGIYSELSKWTTTLTQIQDVLVDAGEKHIRDRSVQTWLNKLQHLTYEIDDVLDDLTTEAARNQLNEESHATTSNSTSKVFKFIPTRFRALKYGRKMSSKLDGITTRLHELIEEKILLGLNQNVESSHRPRRRSEETSLVDESKIIGRDVDKEALLEMLLDGECSSSQTQNVNVVSVVGMGGIGKTTLAQLLYNNKKVKDHFELRAWVCVSDEFNVLTISKAIFKDVGGNDKKIETLNQLQLALTEKLSNKRFLLVLDDVWNESYNQWELLQRPFTVGSPGSKVLVTTRKTTVASMMDSVKAYPMALLSNEEALSLFSQHASGKQNFDVNRTLKLHGEDIVKKCGRLPLALRTAGRVFRTKSSEEEWDELLNSEIWNLDHEKEVLPALRLSYHDLPPNLKQMFVYCCLFSKDYLFDKDELVLLWMAEGFLNPSNKNKSMESCGRECFEELVSRSFFQLSANDKSRYTMHDQIHDVATSVGGEFFCMLDDKVGVRHEALEKAHHLSYIREYGAYENFKALLRAKSLRTFLAMSGTKVYFRRTFDVSNKVLIELLSRLQFLRVLSLANCNVTEVPSSIGSLKHMRFLNLSNTMIACLPNQVGGLLNLQSLLVSGCNELSSLPNSIVRLMNLRHLDISHSLMFEKLPEQVGCLLNLQSLLLSGCKQLSSLPNSIVKLTSLRHLDIANTRSLSQIPSGLCRLTGLQTLSKVIIGGDDEFKISDLKGLLHLQGQLSIEGMHNVKNAGQAREAKLQEKKGLCDLQMEWSGVFDDSRNKTTEYEVLDELRPFEKLRSLGIFYYSGTKFPSWVGDPSFVCLTQLTLRGCKSCTCLPTLGHLPSLQNLIVESLHELKRVGPELLAPANSSYRGVAFPSLEVLRVINMEGLEIWSTSGGDKGGAFPCLRKISIISCPKLDIVAIGLIPSLEILHVEKCSSTVLRSMVSVSSSIVVLSMHDISGLSQLHTEVLEHLQMVEHLQIANCDEVTYLWESEVEAYKILVNLKRLEVISCANLVSLGEKEVHLESSMEHVRKVTIGDCPRLESYNCPKSVEKLDIYSCPSVTSWTFLKMDDLPSSLKELEFSCCHSVASLTFPATDGLLSTLKKLSIQFCDNVEVDWLLLSLLESLSIYDMSNLWLFPEGCLVHLTRLEIVGCGNIESIPDDGYGFLPFHCLRYLRIRDCKNLKSFPHEHLQSLTSLEVMFITKCPSLDDSFPCGLWPPNLSSLTIGELKKPISEWGLPNFPTSLVTLVLCGGNSGVVSFAAKAEDGTIASTSSSSSSSSSFLLPSSLTSLDISDFEELESLLKGMQHLTSLQHLRISFCPKLRDLPETLLPSLSSLMVECCIKLRKKCSRKGKYSPFINRFPLY